MKRKILRIVFSAIFLIVGVVICILSDVDYTKMDALLYDVFSSLLITVCAAGIIFTFIKYNFKRLFVSVAAVNILICIFHSNKIPYGAMMVDNSFVEHFFEWLPVNLLIAVGVSAVVLIAYKLFTERQSFDI